jgi:hypothetical protein
MNKFSRILKAVGIIAVIVLVGIALGWLGSRGGRSNPGPTVSTTTTAPAMANATSPGPAATLSNSAPGLSSSVPSVAGQSPRDISPASTNLITDWEDKLDSILSADGEDADKAKQMLEMFPRLPEEGQTEVAQHLANLTSDEDFPALGKYLTNSTMPESVLDVLMSDLLNRPNSLKLPLLVDVARDSQNPKAGEAKDLLELYLEEDYGTDWNTWQAKVDQWLKDNPD